jgi:hypothetical protein
VDFTREPIIETVITPKEGCKLVVRSSKSAGQEEYFVDAVEVVSFGNSFFFRSLERPKSFLVPANDYEILEVREARMVLKNVGLERSIKIGGGREAGGKPPREIAQEKTEQPMTAPEEELAPLAESASAETKTEGRGDKKRDRRSRYRRRRGGREEGSAKEGETSSDLPEEGEKIELQAPGKEEERVAMSSESIMATPTLLSSILPPPPTLISETIARYKDNAMFKGAFFMREDTLEGDEKEEDGEKGEKDEKEDDGISIPLEKPRLNPFEIGIDEEEEIYRHRATSFSLEDEPLQSEPEKESEEEHKELPTNNNSNS